MARKFALENLGCAKNQVDAEVLIYNLEQDGWIHTEEAAEASLIIVNSCGFIQAAKEESIQVSLDLKRRYPGKKLLLAGCFTQRYGEELKEGLPEVDGFFWKQGPLPDRFGRGGRHGRPAPADVAPGAAGRGLRGSEKGENSFFFPIRPSSSYPKGAATTVPSVPSP